MDAAEVAGILEGEPAAEASVEGLFDEHAFIDLRKHLRDGRARDVAGNPEPLDLAQHTGTAAMLQPYLRAGARQGRAAVIQRPLLREPGHRHVDVGWIEFPAGETGTNLGFRELAAAEHLQPRHVSAVDAVRHEFSVRD